MRVMPESNDNTENKTSSTCMTLVKYNPMQDEDKKSTDEGRKSVTEEKEEEESKNSPIK